MKNKIIAISLTAVLCLSLAACGQTSAPSQAGKDRPSGASGTSQVSASTASEESGAPRTITDLGGHEVTIPAPIEIGKIVILSPPVMSFVVSAIPDTEMIVGINSRSFLTSNPQIVERVLPNWKSVESSFVDVNFAVNTESLLALEPDIIFYYGDFQKKGIEGLSIPAVDFLMKGVNSPEKMSVAWDRQIREILGTDTSVGIQKEWDITNAKLEKLLENVGEQKKRGLCIKLNQAGSIMVMGSDSFDGWAQSFFALSGIENVATSIEGTGEVSMEQIYEWNPDLIMCFQDVPASYILENSIEGQDWSLLTAWKNKQVFDVPRTTYAWVTPCADSPLFPLWLVSKAYPELVSDGEVRTEIKEYYQRNYSVTLTEQDIDSILGYREATGI
ncbi:ABC transporter substrate-binding protein [Oscillibacter sp.]|uniref:ABC transporter substrate-binding protein n=1 Tax=Oscillibacter sp. TaxID=1945593 RepID=UPI0028ADAF8E|nr:ABC transporter substrate-binding protein [Oscillibacter sp.]